MAVKTYRRILIRLAKWAGIPLAVLLILMAILPYFLEDRIAKEVKVFAAENLTGKMNFSKVRLTFFSHFPNLTLNIYDFSIIGSTPFPGDTLVSSREIAFGINLPSLLGPSILIRKIYLDKADIHILVDEQGNPNYNVYVTAPETDTVKKDTASEGTSASLKIEMIRIRRSHLVYNDRSIPLVAEAKDLNYTGSGDLGSEVFELVSEAKIGSLDISYDGTTYLSSKPVRAEMKTKINTRSLSFVFERNKVRIQKVPLEFSGTLDFLETGMAMNMVMASRMGKDYFDVAFKMSGTVNPLIRCQAVARIDLEKWSKALNLTYPGLKGIFNLDFLAEGPYVTGIDSSGIRPRTVILSIPKFSLKSSLDEGELKYEGLSQPVKGISFLLNASCKDTLYKNIEISLTKLHASFLENKVEGYFRLKGLDRYPVDADLIAHCDLATLRQVFPLDSILLDGRFDLRVKAKGNYDQETGEFPRVQATLDLKGGRIRTSWYPDPIDSIRIHAEAIDNTGDLKGLSVNIDPFNFRFEDKPFHLYALLSDFDNLKYDIRSKGEVDLGRIYKVFSMAGLDVKGFIGTDLSLAGNQADATAGRLSQLRNTGTLTLRDISLSYEILPSPVTVRSGNFIFNNDQVRFDNVSGNYVSSDFTLNGTLGNIVNYALTPDAPLKGSLRLHCDRLYLDELAAYSQAPADTAASSVPDSANAGKTGVIIVPSNLRIGLRADAKEVLYQGMTIRDFKGTAEVKDGMILLKQTGFELAGCEVMLDAAYGSIDPVKAFFDFRINAKNFNVQRAYNEVEMFRTLATSAKDVEGVVSLDYSLKGTLDQDMNPVYPSLEGGGVVTLEKVKVMGMKLFSAMSKGTGRESIEKPDLSKVELKTTIKKNVITLEQVKFKMSGFRARVSGTTNFDGALNLKFRLGLPPLGIIGIPMKITGTTDKPKIRYGRGTDESVETTEYSDQLPPELKARIQSAKEEEIPE